MSPILIPFIIVITIIIGRIYFLTGVGVVVPIPPRIREVQLTFRLDRIMNRIMSITTITTTRSVMSTPTSSSRSRRRRGLHERRRRVNDTHQQNASLRMRMSRGELPGRRSRLFLYSARRGEGRGKREPRASARTGVGGGIRNSTWTWTPLLFVPSDKQNSGMPIILGKRSTALYFPP